MRADRNRKEERRGKQMPDMREVRGRGRQPGAPGYSQEEGRDRKKDHGPHEEKIQTQHSKGEGEGRRFGQEDERVHKMHSVRQDREGVTLTPA